MCPQVVYIFDTFAIVGAKGIGIGVIVGVAKDGGLVVTGKARVDRAGSSRGGTVTSVRAGKVGVIYTDTAVPAHVMILANLILTHNHGEGVACFGEKKKEQVLL